MTKMNKYYGTFTQSDTDRKDCYAEIEAENMLEARKKMFDQYGPNWAFVYASKEEAGIEQWRLRKI